jgi:ABC-type amino acid transport substrate-binding protein
MTIDRRTLLAASGLALVPGLACATTSLAEIRRRGHMIVATTGANRPYTFVGPDNQLTGYDIDWTRIICEGLGVEARFNRLDWRGILPGLTAGQFDAVMSAVRITEERLATFDFTEPYGMDDIVVVVPAANTSVQGIEGLRGLVVATATGSVQEAFARANANARELRSLPGLPDMMLNLRNGMVDAAVAGRGGAADFIKTTGAALKIVGPGYQRGPLGMVLRKGSSEILAAINPIIARARADGTYARLWDRWFGGPPPA